MRSKVYYNVLLLFIVSLFQHAVAQSVEVSMNRNSILIGQQISYGLKVVLPGKGFKANFSIPDSIPHFDIIRKGEIVAVKGEDALEQVITFTSFDSGKWYFPSFPVLVSDGSAKVTIFSDSVLIDVGYSPADSTGQLRDIKPVMDVKIIDYSLWYILAAVLGTLIIAYIIYRYLRKRKKTPKPLFNSELSPYEEAMQELRKLEENNQTGGSAVKEFHTTLSGIFRRYYSRKQQKDLLNNTTGDLLIRLKENNISQETISLVSGGLRYTDAVKFAKFLPVPSESHEALTMIKKGIQSLENNPTEKN